MTAEVCALNSHHSSARTGRTAVLDARVLPACGFPGLGEFQTISMYFRDSSTGVQTEGRMGREEERWVWGLKTRAAGCCSNTVLGEGISADCSMRPSMSAHSASRFCSVGFHAGASRPARLLERGLQDLRTFLAGRRGALAGEWKLPKTQAESPFRTPICMLLKTGMCNFATAKQQGLPRDWSATGQTSQHPVDTAALHWLQLAGKHSLEAFFCGCPTPHFLPWTQHSQVQGAARAACSFVHPAASRCVQSFGHPSAPVRPIALPSSLPHRFSNTLSILDTLSMFRSGNKRKGGELPGHCPHGL